jgi:hypothetical protein
LYLPLLIAYRLDGGDLLVDVSTLKTAPFPLEEWRHYATSVLLADAVFDVAEWVR